MDDEREEPCEIADGESACTWDASTAIRWRESVEEGRANRCGRMSGRAAAHAMHRSFCGSRVVDPAALVLVLSPSGSKFRKASVLLSSIGAAVVSG